MRILIVAPKYTPVRGQFYQFPLGLGYIISALKHAGFDVHALNCNESDEPSDLQVARMVTLLDPQICATGALSPFLPKVQEIFNAARRAKPSIVNIAGGGVLSSDPEAGPKVMDIDIGVIGEGEETIVDVVRTLQEGADRRHQGADTSGRQEGDHPVGAVGHQQTDAAPLADADGQQALGQLGRAPLDLCPRQMCPIVDQQFLVGPALDSALEDPGDGGRRRERLTGNYR